MGKLSGRLCVIAVFLAVSFYLQGCGGVQKKPEPSKNPEELKKETVEQTWGVRVEGVRLSAGGYMLDFRYRVVDPEKAAPLVDRKVSPYLMDKATGAKFMVPAPGKVGPLRQTPISGKPAQDKIYFILFANPGKYVKQGSQVTVVLGDFRAEDIIVE